MIKSKLQIRQESLIPYLAAICAMVATFILFLDWNVSKGGAVKLAMDNSMKGEVLIKIGWVLQILGMIAMLVCLFALVRKSLMLLAIPIGLNALGLLFRSLADSKYWIALVIFLLTGWCFVMAVDAGQSAFKTITYVLCFVSLGLTILLCIPGVVESVGNMIGSFRPLLCYQDGATEEGTAAVWNWNVSYIVYIVSYLSVILLILFGSTTQFVAETEEEKDGGAAEAGGDPFEAMKNLYKLKSGAEEQVKKENEEKAPEKPVKENVKPEPEKVIVEEVVPEKEAAQSVGAEPVYTVPVSGSRLQKSLKEEIVYDRDQKLEHRNVVRSFSVVGMIISFLMMVGGVLLLTDVIHLQYNTICGIMLIAVGVGLFCVFGNNLTYKEYYMKTIVTERKVVHEESNWEEVLANRLEEDERNIASLTETYARMTDMYAKLLASTAELSNSVKALGMRAAQQELPVSDDVSRAAEEPAPAPYTEEDDTDEELRRIEEELRAIDAEAERQRAEAERIAREQEERRRAEEELRKAEEERLRAEEELRREAEERIARENAARLAREEEERIAREAEERIAREAEERIAREAEERIAKEAEERLAKEAEEAARKHLAEAFGDEFGADEVAKAYEAAMAEGLSSKDIANSFRKESLAAAAAVPVVAAVATDAAEAEEPVAENVTEVAEAIEEPVAEAIEEPVAEAVETVEEAAAEVTEAVEDIPAVVEEKVEEISEAVEEIPETVEETVAEAVEEIPEAVEEKAEDIVEEIPETIEEVTEEITESAEDKIEETAEAIEEPAAEVTETVEEAVEEVTEPADEAIEEIGDAAAEATETAENISEAVEEIPEAVEDKAAEVVEEIPEAVEEKAEEVVEEIPEAIEEVTEEITESAEDKIEEATEAIEEPVAEVTETVEDNAEELTETADEAIAEVTETAEDISEAVEEIPEAVEEAADTFTIPTYSFPAAPKTEEEPDEIPDPFGGEIEPANDNADLISQISSDIYKPVYQDTPASNQSWFMGDRIADDSAAKESSPAFSFFGGLGLQDEDNGSRSEDDYGTVPQNEETSDFGFGAQDTATDSFGFGPQNGSWNSETPGEADGASDEDDAYGTNPYGYEPVRTEREIIEGFVLPTFNGLGFDTPDENESYEDDFYKPGYKIKSFAKKNTSWMEDDEVDDFGTPVTPEGIKLDDLVRPAEAKTETVDVPMNEEPAVPMDDEPELPMDEEPALPMDEEPELPMDLEPDLPMDDEPDVPMDDEPELPMNDEPVTPMDDEPVAPMDDEPEFPVEEPKEEPAAETPAEPVSEEAEKPAEGEEDKAGDEKAEVAKEEKKEDGDRLTRLQQKLAEIRARNSEKYGGDIFLGDDDF
ncbi:MAG: hypothetical protein IJL03_02245 [Lachnospiraceae bacterium]|nr:hypothetical protein [Lachnospiraceae bacterium]